MAREALSAMDVFKALGDPIRWNIVQQMAAVEELACSLLEDTLPVSKPTISYHTKILTQAGLIEVRKRGRNYFYALRRDVLRDVTGQLLSLGLDPSVAGPGAAVPEGPPLKAAAGDDVVAPPRLLTW